MDEIVLSRSVQLKLRDLLVSLQRSHSDYDYDKSLVEAIVNECPSARVLFGDIYKERGLIES